MWSSELTKLFPFYLSQILYWFIFYIPSSEEPNLFTLAIKCLPVLTLANYIAFSEWNNNRTTKWLFWGMFFSIGGDAFLVYNHLFVLGMVSFAMAQISFIRAFGFNPLKPGIAVILLGLLATMLSILVPNIDDEAIKIGFPIYGLLLATMTWRALARSHQGSIEKLTALGAVLFMISDTCIGVNLFYSKLEYAQVIIMTTYYAAQFLITLSVVKNVVQLDKQQKQK
jgi:alkenylglycerophosphocholine/alkenylglycerophosphoethanolamine hydrolase